MRHLIFILILLFSESCSEIGKNPRIEEMFRQTQRTGVVHPSFNTKVKLNDIIVCSSTITDIIKLGYRPVFVPQEKIDSIINNKNNKNGRYYYDVTNNIIFFTFDSTELIGSIFIKDNFNGTLRGINIANFSNLTLHDIISGFKDLHWSTTSSGEYWIYGNDTIDFYVKKDKAIRQFPLNKKFYEAKHPSFAEIKIACREIFREKYIDYDTVIQKPMYAPLTDSHVNFYVINRLSWIERKLGGQNKDDLKKIRIGRWLTYNPNHTIQKIEYYDNGKLVSTKNYYSR